jgi:hypothetical protein
MSRRAVAALVLVVSAAAGPAAPAQARPALRLVALSPVSVHGSGFGAREQVRVRLRAHATFIATRHVRATRRGGFTVRFAKVLIDRCSAFSVTAVGRSGRRATLARERAVCPPR